jgi:hypothetical protein
MFGEQKMIDKVLQFSYATSIAFSQALMTFAQIRADQAALSNMTAIEIQALAQPVAHRSPIGFTKCESEN